MRAVLIQNYHRSGSPFSSQAPASKRGLNHNGSSSSRIVDESNHPHRGYFSVFSGVEQSSTPAFAVDTASSDGNADLASQQQHQPYARFPLSRPMSPPVRSKYVASPPPRANSTPPTAQHHHYNNQQQRQIEEYEYSQLLMGMSQASVNDKVCQGGRSSESRLICLSASPFSHCWLLNFLLWGLFSSMKKLCQKDICNSSNSSRDTISGWASNLMLPCTHHHHHHIKAWMLYWTRIPCHGQAVQCLLVTISIVCIPRDIY